MNYTKKNLRNEFVATGYILNKKRNKILMLFHKKAQLWVPPGGHLDDNELPHEAVIREVLEETGLIATIFDVSIDLKMKPSSTEWQIPTPLCILHEVIPARPNEPQHLHVDFCYAMTTGDERVTLAKEEAEKIAWFSLDEIMKLNTFEGVRCISKKLLTIPDASSYTQQEAR